MSCVLQKWDISKNQDSSGLETASPPKF